MLELSKNEEKISSKAGFAKFPEVFISDFKFNANSAPSKGLN